MALKPRQLHQPTAPANNSRSRDLALLSETELLKLRAEIDGLLDLKTLDEMDIGHELTVQLQIAKLLQAETLDDTETPANQKAQTLNSVTALLKELSKTRTEVYNAERARQIEACVIKAFNRCPTALHNPSAESLKILNEIKGLFFEQYEALLKAAEKPE